MTEAMIEVALEGLSSLVQKELALFLGVHDEMERLSGVLSAIKAVLEDAEEKQLTDKALKNWLHKLRDAARLLDYILDEISTHALSLEYQGKVQGSFLSSFNPTHIKFRYKIAKKLKHISRRLDGIAEEKLKFHYLRETVHERRNQVMEWRQTTSIITQPQFYGREADKEKVVGFLVGDASDLEDLSVYPIIGMGGLGKTTLAQHVFHDERVVHHFEPRIWVCVSEDFNLKRLSKAILEAAGHDCKESELEPLQRKVQELLGRKRYLLVLDDVWNERQEKWDKLKYALACGSKGASILLTTRLTTVARITGTTPPHELSKLSEDDCWELFRQRAFGLEKEECVKLVDIGQGIVKKCKGVPLAAKTLGSLLRFQRDENCWLHIKESEIWNLSQDEDAILPALRLSYLNLPIKLRQCFAYLAVFPKDQEMSKRRVIELWMANGFISTGEMRDAEQDGDRVWNELYSRSFFVDIQINEFDYDTKFKMHDLVHDLAQSVMGKKCCSWTLENGLPGEGTLHLYFDGYEFHKQCSSHLNKVKSLMTFICPESFETYISGNTFVKNYISNVYIPGNIFMKHYTLRALDLKRLNEVSSSIDQLKHLRYLNLSNGSFKMLPDSICRLWNLQILNLNYCHQLQKLPSQMKCLKSLRHLHLKFCVSLSGLRSTNLLEDLK